MKASVVVFCILSVLIAVSCQSNVSEVNEEIKYNDLTVRTYSELPEVLWQNFEYITLKLENKEEMFSSADKVLFKSGKLYVLDEIYGKIIAYNSDGTSDMLIAKKGRGPGEYTQITDFDVDNEGNVWVLDATKDCIIQYAPNGEHLSTADISFQAEFIKCVDEGFLFGLAPWDASGNQLVLTDEEMTVKEAYLEYDENVDPNYVLPASGFTTSGQSIFYHRPIDDKVYSLDLSSASISIYSFNFGKRTCPDYVRKNIDSYRSDFEYYSVLVKTVFVGDNLIVGSVLEGHQIKDFMISKSDNSLYLQNEDFMSMCRLGISNSYAIFYVLPGASNVDYLPLEVKSDYQAGSEIFMLLPIDSL